MQFIITVTTLLCLATVVQAQEVINMQPATGSRGATVSAPPSVDNGLADGIAKRAGAPSVSNGTSNGIVKQAGAPSVGDGIANGVVKDSTINQ